MPEYSPHNKDNSAPGCNTRFSTEMATKMQNLRTAALKKILFQVHMENIFAEKMHELQLHPVQTCLMHVICSEIIGYNENASKILISQYNSNSK